MIKEEYDEYNYLLQKNQSADGIGGIPHLRYCQCRSAEAHAHYA